MADAPRLITVPVRMPPHLPALLEIARLTEEICAVAAFLVVKQEGKSDFTD
jgi:hypothetical protein